MHERSKYTAATFSLLDMGFYTGDHHKDVRKSEVKRSQDKVSITVDAFENFLNPFSVKKKTNCTVYHPRQLFHQK